MKKLFFLTGLLLISIGLQAQNKVTLDGKIKGLTSKKVYLMIPKSSGMEFDSTQVNNGAFHFEREVMPNTYALINTGMKELIKRVGAGYFPNKSANIALFLSPGAKIKIEGKITDFADAYPSGDEANNTLSAINKACYPLDNETANLYVKLDTEKPADPSTIQTRIDELDTKIVEIKRNALFQNPNSVATIWLMSDMMMRQQLSNEDAQKIFPKISAEKFESIPYYQEVKNRVSGLTATAIGQQVPEIIIDKDYHGQPFKLSTLQGKYVLIDFWGTWCHPCLEGMPKMKEYQDKYKEKLTLVGIAKDKESFWRTWLASKPEYDWIQLLDQESQSQVLKFNVNGFPTKILISPDGKILARFMGEDNQLYEKLDELLAK